MSWSRNQKLLILALLLAGLIFKVAYWAWAPPDYSARESDYDDIAQNWLAGKGFSIDQSYGLNPSRLDDSKPNIAPTASRTPLYPMLLAAIYKVFGRRIGLVYIVQTAMDMLSAVILLFIALKVTNNRKAALLSMAFYTCYPPFIEQVAVLLNETLFGLLLLLFALVAITALQRFSVKWFVLAGACLGLTALCRPTTFLFPVVFLPAALIINRKRLRQAAINSLVFLVSFVALIMPWMIRNYIVTDYFGLVGTRGGEQLFAANYHLVGAKHPMPMVSPEMEKKLAGKTQKEINKILTREGLKEIIKHPVRFAGNAVFRTFTFWTSIGMGKPGILYFSSNRSGREVCIFVAIFNTFFIVASILAFVRYRGKWTAMTTVPLLVLGYFYIIHLPIVALIRYSIPIIPFLMVFAAVWAIGIFSSDQEGVV